MADEFDNSPEMRAVLDIFKLDITELGKAGRIVGLIQDAFSRGATHGFDEARIQSMSIMRKLVRCAGLGEHATRLIVRATDIIKTMMPPPTEVETLMPIGTRVQVVDKHPSDASGFVGRIGVVVGPIDHASARNVFFDSDFYKVSCPMRYLRVL